MSTELAAARRVPGSGAQGAVFSILLALSFSHFLNDMISSLVPAIYPMLKRSYGLSFGQIGLITLSMQTTASLLQPGVGLYTDRRPLPYSLACGMGATLCGLLLLSHAGSFVVLLCAASLVGVGSSVFHPESSRVARMASGGRHGLAQSLFQVGGNAGSAAGPMLAALIVLPHGQASVAWFSAAALLAICVLTIIGGWYRRERVAILTRPARPVGAAPNLSRRQVRWTLVILMTLCFSKYFYLASLTSYYTFYLIQRFHVSVANAQVHLFVFLASVAVGTLIGGPIGDRIGRKSVIWCSIVGVLPFTLMLPHADLMWTGILSVAIGLTIASAFSAILVYAQELVPGKVGMIGGMFFGFAFGIGGVGAAALGQLADATSITYVYDLCAFLPAIGLLTALLPAIEPPRRAAQSV